MATQTAPTTSIAQIDHIVVVADSLVQGVAWCESALGITPGPGGEHALFGTHNRLFKIATAQNPTAYFEIIAINTIAAYASNTGAKRWFDMDDMALQQAVKIQPRLVHFVASVPNASAACSALKALEIERGNVIQASRPTPHGLLEWQMTVREDGQRLFNGALPTLIEWGDIHPTHTMPSSGFTLHSLVVSHPEASLLQAAYQAIGLHSVNVSHGAANLCATLQTPKGLVRLESFGL